MLIDATHPEETRVVVVDGTKVEEFDFETAARRQLSGNIYLAKVTRVEPSLQAAFVDYGGNRHGFLAFAEIHPDYYQIPVADRQALLAEERAFARSLDDEDGEGRGRRRAMPAGAGEGRAARAEAPSAAPAPAAAGVPGMDVVDLGDDASEAGTLYEGAEAAPAAEAEEPRERPYRASTTPPRSTTRSNRLPTRTSARKSARRESRGRRSTRSRTSIKRRQILLVQVVKEERGNKGAALTTYLVARRPLLRADAQHRAAAAASAARSPTPRTASG